MTTSLSLPLCDGTRRSFGGWESLKASLKTLGIDGAEGIWAGEDIPGDLPAGLLRGYHLTFFPDWLDLYRNDTAALERKYGSLSAAKAFYGGLGPKALLRLYRADLRRAEALGAEYVVFHVSDVSVEEGYTYRWLHSDEEVISASVEIINELFSGGEPPFEFLLENQWWPGFTFTKPELTFSLLEGVKCARKGIMLDTGHLMNTNLSIASQSGGIAYINKMLDEHGLLCRSIRGVHLHRSISGDYVRAHTGAMPEGLPEDPAERFGVSYGHIQKIDRHEPWTEPSVAGLIDRISPQYLTHELSSADAASLLRAAALQTDALRKGRRPD